jgi:hypothetical protein
MLSSLCLKTPFLSFWFKTIVLKRRNLDANTTLSVLCRTYHLAQPSPHQVEQNFQGNPTLILVLS